MNNKKTIKNVCKLTTLAMPIIATGMINMISGFVSMRMVAQISRAELAAGALSLSTFIGIMTVTATIFYAVGILISHKSSAEQTFADVGRIVKNGLWLALLLSIPAGLALWNVDGLLYLSGQKPELVNIAKGYFHYAAPNMLAVLVMMVITQFYTATGRAHFGTIISIAALPLTILLAYGFILGNFGLPRFGLGGLTLAGFIAQSIIVTAVILFMFLSGDMKKYAIFSDKLLPDMAICKSIFALGLPIGLQFGGEIAAMAVSTNLLGRFGIIPLASAQIVSQYVLFAVMIILGITQALSLLTSEAYGKKDLSMVKEYLHAAMILLLGCFAIIWLLFMVLPEVLIKMFVHADLINADITHLAITFFKISSVMLLLDGLRNMYSGSLRGLHDSKAPMRIGIICLWLISLPLCYLIGFTLHGGPVGQRIGFVSGFAVATVLLWLRLRSKLNILNRNSDIAVEAKEEVFA